MEFSAHLGSVIHTAVLCQHHTLPENLTSFARRRFLGCMILLRTVVAAAAITLAVPALAQAKTKDMYVGSPPATTKKLGEATVANAFFPSKLTVNAGDSVSFIPALACPAPWPRSIGGCGRQKKGWAAATTAHPFPSRF